MAAIPASSGARVLAAAAARPAQRQLRHRAATVAKSVGGASSSLSALRGSGRAGGCWSRRGRQPRGMGCVVARGTAASYLLKAEKRNKTAAGEGVKDVTCAMEAGEEKPLDLRLASIALMTTFALAYFAAPDPAAAADLAQYGDHADGTQQLWSVAGGEVPFWANMVKYARFSISIMVGFAFMFGRPIVNLLKKPQTAILVIGGGYGGYKFFKWTIETMLGMSDPDTLNYEMTH